MTLYQKILWTLLNDSMVKATRRREREGFQKPAKRVPFTREQREAGLL